MARRHGDDRGAGGGPGVPGGRRLGEDDRSALAVGGTAKIRSGDIVVFCKAVAVAPAKVRRDGRVQAQGSPCDHARLGAAEERLEEMAGPGAVGALAAGPGWQVP